jgi:multiple sugar transport system permease protein
LVLMVLGSLGTPGLPAPDGGFDLVPWPPQWENYEYAVTAVPLRAQLLNSALVAAIAVPVSVFVASATGFALLEGGRVTRRTIAALTMLALFVPPMMLWVPRVALMDRVGLSGEPLVLTYSALMGTSPLLVLLFAVVYHQLPRAPLEVARLEGLSALRCWWTVVLPGAPYAVFGAGAIAFIIHWGNVVEPLLLLTRPESQTAALGIRELAALDPTFYPILLAAAVIVSLPPVLVLLLAQGRLFRAVPLPGGAR